MALILLVVYGIIVFEEPRAAWGMGGLFLLILIGFAVMALFNPKWDHRIAAEGITEFRSTETIHLGWDEVERVQWQSDIVLMGRRQTIRIPQPLMVDKLWEKTRRQVQWYLEPYFDFTPPVALSRSWKHPTPKMILELVIITIALGVFVIGGIAFAIFNERIANVWALAFLFAPFLWVMVLYWEAIQDWEPKRRDSITK